MSLSKEEGGVVSGGGECLWGRGGGGDSRDRRGPRDHQPRIRTANFISLGFFFFPFFWVGDGVGRKRGGGKIGVTRRLTGCIFETTIVFDNNRSVSLSFHSC